MPDATPVDPNSSSPLQGPQKAEPKHFSYKGGEVQAKPMTFLGMHFNSDEAKKLWNILIQNLNSTIEKEKAKALKALKKLRAGREDDD